MAQARRPAASPVTTAMVHSLVASFQDGVPMPRLRKEHGSRVNRRPCRRSHDPVGSGVGQAQCRTLGCARAGGRALMLSCVLVIGITGTVSRPLCVLLGRCADTGELVLAARSTPAVPSVAVEFEGDTRSHSRVLHARWHGPCCDRRPPWHPESEDTSRSALQLPPRWVLRPDLTLRPRPCTPQWSVLHQVLCPRAQPTTRRLAQPRQRCPLPRALWHRASARPRRTSNSRSRKTGSSSTAPLRSGKGSGAAHLIKLPNRQRVPWP